MKEIEEKLNKEYEYIGTISIKKIHEDVIDIERIGYVSEIMEKIEPSKNNDPVIIASGYSYKKDYKIIDGYHRLKNKLENGEKSIKVIILDKYSIDRKGDSLFDFLEKSVGKSIRFIDSNTFVIDKKYYKIKENEGCGGCNNGWSSIEVSKCFLNEKMKIKKIDQIYKTKYYNADEYELFINDKKIADVNTGWGNGYYGGDFEINLIN